MPEEERRANGGDRRASAGVPTEVATYFAERDAHDIQSWRLRNLWLTLIIVASLLSSGYVALTTHEIRSSQQCQARSSRVVAVDVHLLLTADKTASDYKVPSEC